MIAARPMLFAAGFALAALLPSPAAVARTNFDGNWSVLIVTNSGQCDRAYRYGIAIRDGRVIYQGSAAVNVEGRVKKNGQVDVRVSGGSQIAYGRGRMSLDYGTGRWRGDGSTGSCSGVWTAERR